MERARVLLAGCEDEPGLAVELERVLGSTAHVGIPLEAERTGDVSQFDLVLALLSRPDPELARAMLDRLGTAVPVWIVTPADTVEAMIELLRLGASEVVLAPIRAADLLPRIWRALSLRERAGSLAHRLKQTLGISHMIGRSENFLAEVRKIPLAAGCDATVLILGETGTGKELFARALHYLSARSDKPFTPVNCGALPVDLVENELFGHHSGAYTGAGSAHPGLVQQTDGGTLFLDEIDCLPLLAQVKLLRLLQEKEYRPLGSVQPRTADVRVIAASNSDLAEAVKNGSLRKDLYYRLSVFPLTLPPLRDRRSDVAELARHFLKRYAAEFGRPVRAIRADVMERLVAHSWPGNVRELENTIERAVVLCSGGELLPEHILMLGAESCDRPGSFRQAKARMVEDFEKSYIEGLLAAHEGNVTRAAAAAKKNRRAFFELMRKHDIDPSAYRRANRMAAGGA